MRSPRRVMCATVLACEALVVFFAVLVAVPLSGVPAPVVVAVGAGMILACIMVAGLLRYRWAYPLGSACQVLLVASGLAVPAMLVVGGMFAVLWFVALSTGGRLEREPHAQ